MNEINSISCVILILGSLYFHYKYGMDGIITLLLVVFGMSMWISIREEMKKNEEKRNQV